MNEIYMLRNASSSSSTLAFYEGFFLDKGKAIRYAEQENARQKGDWEEKIMGDVELKVVTIYRSMGDD